MSLAAACCLAANPVLRFCTEASPTSFDPAIASSATDRDVVATPLFDTLLKISRDGKQLLPGLAERWAVSADGLRYDFQLRAGVRFHHTAWFQPSRTLNADDVLFTLQRLLDPQHPFRHAWPVESPYVLSYGLQHLISRVEQTGPLSVRLHLRQPDSTLLRHLAASFAAIHSAEYAGQLLKQGRASQLGQLPVGSGPFVFERYQQDALLRYQRHAAYWGKPAHVEKLLIAIVPDGSVRSQKLQRGECDLAALLPPAEWNVLAANPAIDLLRITGSNIGLLNYNLRKPALAKLAVRQALDLAIDRTAILQAVYQGRAQLARSGLPPFSWAYDASLPLLRHDPLEARRLLQQAGVRQLKLKLWAMPLARVYNPNARLMAEMIQADWARIGVQAEIVSYEWGEYLRRLDQGEHDVALAGWTLGSDPDFLYSSLQCQAGRLNHSGWCNAEFDQLVQAAKRISKQSERLRLYRRAEAILLRELPFSALAHAELAYARRRSVQGLTVSPQGDWQFDGLSVAE